MSRFVRICSASEVPAEGRVSEITVEGRALCVAKVDGVVAVLDSYCPHDGGPLGEGMIEKGRVVCPWHGYAFDVRTGLTANDPELKAEVLDARLEDGELRVYF
jgi:nitrite reductase (NADH) small subunit